MMPADHSDVRIDVRLPSELKDTIEAAATALGQTVNEFAVSAMIREARRVLDESQVTRLSNRDRDRFLEALDAVEDEANEAILAAKRRYEKRRA